MSGRGEIHVLLVEDDPTFLDVAAAYLRHEGDRIEVITATAADDALALLAEQHVDCVVSDYGMPDTDGMEFLEAVRERDPLLPFVMLTGVGSETLASEAVSAGADAYVPKDGRRDRFDILLQRVETLVSQARAETSYREVFEKAAVAMSVRDPETGAFLDANDRYCELMGYSHEEIRSLTSDDVGVDEPPYTTERAHEYLRRAVEEGPQTVEWVNERRDGTRLRVEVELKPATIGGRTRVLVSVRDVTEQYEHERTLRELHERTQELMRAETRTEIASVAAATARETLGLSLSGVHLEDGSGTLEGIAATDPVRELFDGVPDYERRPFPNAPGLPWEVFESGERVVVEDTTTRASAREESPMRSGILHPLGDHGVFITSSPEPNDFDETEVALTEMLATATTTALDRIDRQQRYDAIFNQTFQFTGLMEPDGTLVEANEAALEFVETPREAVIGEPLWETPWFQFGEWARRMARDSVEQARDGEFFRDELPIVGGDGEEIIVDYSVRPVTDEHGDVTLLVPEGRDITELKEREAELERKNEQLQEFASVVSHDLRSPLAVARGYLDVATGSGDSEALDRVDHAHERMEALIDDLLTLARQETTIDELEAVALESLSRRFWQNVDTGAAELSVASNLGFDADPSRLAQLFENLFRNAVEHADAAAVTVGALDDDRGFYVEDDGPGIPADQRDRIFEMGYSTGDEGTGFGLHIVETIATTHGWEIAATESTDGGARFEVTGVEVRPADGKTV